MENKIHPTHNIPNIPNTPNIPPTNNPNPSSNPNSNNNPNQTLRYGSFVVGNSTSCTIS